jgi:hypothetical protein
MKNINKSTWSIRRAKIVELQKKYPILRDILDVNRALESFTLTHRDDKVHDSNFDWLEKKLIEMSK